jgi:hypothetical protein
VKEPDRLRQNECCRRRSHKWHRDRFAGEFVPATFIASKVSVSGIFSGEAFIELFPLQVFLRRLVRRRNEAPVQTSASTRARPGAGLLPQLGGECDRNRAGEASVRNIRSREDGKLQSIGFANVRAASESERVLPPLRQSNIRGRFVAVKEKLRYPRKLIFVSCHVVVTTVRV